MASCDVLGPGLKAGSAGMLVRCSPGLERCARLDSERCARICISVGEVYHLGLSGVLALIMSDVLEFVKDVLASHVDVGLPAS